MCSLPMAANKNIQLTRVLHRLSDMPIGGIVQLGNFRETPSALTEAIKYREYKAQFHLEML